MALIIVLVSALASARVWRALMLDDIGLRFRNLVDRGAGGLYGFFDCPWCFGFWLCVAFVTLGVTLPASLFLLIAGPFAANYISANLNVHLGDKQ